MGSISVATPLLPPEARLSGPAELHLTRLIQQYFDFVWRLLRRIGVPESDADDAAQQVFITAAQRLDDICPGSERAFLASTAFYVGARAHRGRTRKREDFGVDLDTQEDTSPSPEELLDRRRARELLDSLLAAMSLELRAVFVLYEIEQLTSAEIAEIIGVPLGTVASRLRRAREDFRARVARLDARRNPGGRNHD